MTQLRSSGYPGSGAVAELIRQQREAVGLPQTELAQRAQVSRSRIIAAEAGASLPTLEFCLKLARAMEVPLSAMFRAHATDALAAADPAALEELQPELGRSSWDALAEHQGLRVEQGRVQGSVDAAGNLSVVRHFSGCSAIRPRHRIVFRDRIVGEQAPLFAVKGSPRGLGYSMHVSIDGAWALHRVEFARPWTPEDGPFEFEIETRLPQAFVLDLEQWNQRRIEEGLESRGDWIGEYLYNVVHTFERLELGIAFPSTYRPTWLDPSATFGNAPVEDADYHELDARTSRSSSFDTHAHAANLVVERPVPGFTFGIRWLPACPAAKEVGQ